MLTFVHLWAFALLPLPWLVRKFMPPRKGSEVSVRVPFGERLRASAADCGAVSRVAKSTAPLIAPSLVWILILGALARPQWLEPPVTKDLPARDLLLLVDLSGSMRQEDFVSAAGDKVDRLTAVKEVLGDFLSRREGDRVGLVVFGDAPFLQAPFSTDLELSGQLLEETAVGMAGPRTALGDAIGLGISLFEESDAPAKTIIALTDGNDTKSQVPPIEAARVATERNISIHTVAIGDPSTVGEEKLDEETLRSVAEVSQGSYFYAADRAQLEGIYDELDKLETRAVNVVSYRPRTDLFFWALLAGLLVWLVEKGMLARSQGRDSRSKSEPRSVHVNQRTGSLDVTG